MATAEHASRRRSLAAGLMALCVLLLIAIGAIRDTTPTAVSPAGAPDREFSAQRAFAHVERFAVKPHPVGTAEHTRVRDYLVGELRRLGLRPEVHEAVGVSPIDEQGDPVTAGRVFNIVTVIPGTAPTGRVFVTAHYDSVPEGPGANDDGAGTASAIETARALVADGTRLRNDVVFLITDAEEAGLLGSEAFVKDHPLAKGRSVVLNNEARGAKGPVLMFRSTESNSGLISMFGSAAPMPVADSVYAELMKLLNNDTDFTAFKPGGMAVLDSAFANAGTMYHSVIDDPAHVDLAALQQMGDNTLALVRAFGGTDLAQQLTTGNDLVYFNLPPSLLVRYPTWAATLLGGVALLAALALIFQARRRNVVTLRRTLLGTALALISIGLGVGVGISFWDLLKVIRPEFSGTATTTPYQPEPFWLAVVMLAGTILLAWYALLRRRVGAAELALGMLTWVALIGLGLGIVSPGASHLAAWPALGAALGGLAALRCPPRWRVLMLAAGLVPGALIMLPSAWNTLPTGLQYAGYAPMPLVILFGGLLLPLIEMVWPGRRSPLVPLTALVVSIALVAAGLLVEPIDKEHPRRTSLAYGLDADTGKAVWLTSKAPDQWARRYGGTNPAGQPPAELWGDSKLLSPAKAAPLPAPSLRVLADTTQQGVRTLRVRIHSERGANTVGLRVDGDTATVSSLTVEGRSITVDPAGFIFRAPGPDGVEVSLVVKGSGGKIRLRVTDVSPNPSEMSALPGFITPPDWLFLGDTKISVTKLYAV